MVDRVGFEPTISPMPRAYPTSLDDRPTGRQAPAARGGAKIA